MNEGQTCYERDEAFCEDQMCLRTGCRLQIAKENPIDDYAEWAAKWHDEWAANCRHVAEQTRKEWTGPQYSSEDNRANHADARNYDRKASEHENHAKAFRAMKQAKLSPDLKASQRPTVSSETTSLTKGTEPGAVTDGREQQDHDIADNAERALHEIAHLPDGSDLHEATLIALRALPLIEDKPEGAFHRSWCAWCGGTCECDEDPPDDLSDGLPHLNRSEHTSADFAACEDCPPLSYPTDKTRCTPCPRRALSRNSTDE